MNAAEFKRDLRYEVTVKGRTPILLSSMQDNWAKLTSRYSGESTEQTRQQINAARNFKFHGKTSKHEGYFPSLDTAPCQHLASLHEGTAACKEGKYLNEERAFNASKLEATRQQQGMMSRFPGKTESYLHMVCSGKRLGLDLMEPISCSNSIANSWVGKYNQESLTEIKTSVNHLSSNRILDGQGTDSHSFVLNKLYSSLKKVKSRRTENEMRDGNFYSVVGDPNGDVKSIFLPISNKNSNIYREEYLLLGGRSKPVRFAMNVDDLNLLEQEFGLQLKARKYSRGGEADLMLIQQFRDKFKSVRKPNDKNFGVTQNMNVDIPWARHIIRKREKSDFQSSLELNSGKTLSIHVYLPNAAPKTENPSD